MKKNYHCAYSELPVSECDHCKLPAAQARIAELEADLAKERSVSVALSMAERENMEQRIAELTKERDEAAERAGRAEQAMSSLRVLHAEGGKFHVTLDVAKEVAAAICDCLAVLTDNAKNYVECSMTNKHGDRWTMTVVKPSGKTPNTMRIEAEQERDAAVKRVGELTAWQTANAGKAEAYDRLDVRRQEAESGRQYWMREALGRETEGDDRDVEMRSLAAEVAELRAALTTMRDLFRLGGRPRQISVHWIASMDASIRAINACDAALAAGNDRDSTKGDAT